MYGLPGVDWSGSTYDTYLQNQSDFNYLMYQKYCAEQAAQENVTVRVFYDLSQATPVPGETVTPSTQPATPAQPAARPARSGGGTLTPFAREVFSQVYDRTQFLTDPMSIPAFYGASAAAGLGIPAMINNLPVLGTTLGGLSRLGRQLLNDPRVISFIEDVLSGYAPSPPPLTVGGILGFQLGNIDWEEKMARIKNTLR